MNKAVFLDRDGTIIIDKKYISDVNDVELIEGITEPLKKLVDMGYLLIIVTNQSGVARGYFDVNNVKKINKKVEELLEDKEIKISATYFCPHLLGGKEKKYSIDCECRKPKIGMIIRAAGEFNINLKESYMIGDKKTDYECGINFGAKKSYLLQTNKTGELYKVVKEIEEKNK